MLNITSKRILLFSDFHWGKSRDSEAKINANDKFIEFLIETSLKLKIKEILFLGDWFDDRTSINVKTSDHARKALQKISKAGLTIYMIVGNHDSYFKNSIEVNSLSQYTDIDNVFVFDTKTEINLNGKTAALYPWDTYNKADSNNYDIIFGHFEWEGAVYVPNSTVVRNEQHYNGDDLTTTAPIVVSGHYHIRKKYQHKNGYIQTLGCPLELDWGDYGNEKGVHVLDTTTLELKFIENTLSPRHNKLYWSSNKNKLDKTVVENNYIKLIVDDDYEFADIVSILNDINSLHPIKPCETEFIFNKMVTKVVENSNVQLAEERTDNLQYVYKYMEGNIAPNTNGVADIDISKLKTILSEYYHKVSTT